jgi:hypothetical protein
MNTITETKQYFLTSGGNTVNKINGSLNSNVNFYVPRIISYNKNTLYHTIKISHLEIPYSFYIINSNNNVLVVNATALMIPVGNYNALTLLETINSLFLDTFEFDISLSFENSTGKYTLTSDNFVYIASSSTIAKVIGLEKGFNYNSIFDFSSSQYIIEFPYLVNTAGIRNIFIKSNLITNNYSAYNGDSLILKSIPVNVPPYGIIIYNNNENIETMVKNRELNNIQLQLIDDEGYYIDFNNLDWSICIEIKTISQLTINNYNINDFFNQQDLTDINNNENDIN